MAQNQKREKEADSDLSAGGLQHTNLLDLLGLQPDLSPIKGCKGPSLANWATLNGDRLSKQNLISLQRSLDERYTHLLSTSMYDTDRQKLLNNAKIYWKRNMEFRFWYWYDSSKCTLDDDTRRWPFCISRECRKTAVANKERTTNEVAVEPPDTEMQDRETESAERDVAAKVLQTAIESGVNNMESLTDLKAALNVRESELIKIALSSIERRCTEIQGSGQDKLSGGITQGMEEYDDTFFAPSQQSSDSTPNSDCDETAQPEGQITASEAAAVKVNEAPERNVIVIPTDDESSQSETSDESFYNEGQGTSGKGLPDGGHAIPNNRLPNGGEACKCGHSHFPTVRSIYKHAPLCQQVPLSARARSKPTANCSYGCRQSPSRIYKHEALHHYFCKGCGNVSIQPKLHPGSKLVLIHRISYFLGPKTDSLKWTISQIIEQVVSTIERKVIERFPLDSSKLGLMFHEILVTIQSQRHSKHINIYGTEESRGPHPDNPLLVEFSKAVEATVPSCVVKDLLALDSDELGSILDSKINKCYTTESTSPSPTVAADEGGPNPDVAGDTNSAMSASRNSASVLTPQQDNLSEVGCSMSANVNFTLPEQTEGGRSIAESPSTASRLPPTSSRDCDTDLTRLLSSPPADGSHDGHCPAICEDEHPPPTSGRISMGPDMSLNQEPSAAASDVASFPTDNNSITVSQVSYTSMQNVIGTIRKRSIDDEGTESLDTQAKKARLDQGSPADGHATVMGVAQGDEAGDDTIIAPSLGSSESAHRHTPESNITRALEITADCPTDHTSAENIGQASSTVARGTEVSTAGPSTTVPLAYHTEPPSRHQLPTDSCQATTVCQYMYTTTQEVDSVCQYKDTSPFLPVSIATAGHAPDLVDGSQEISVFGKSQCISKDDAPTNHNIPEEEDIDAEMKRVCCLNNLEPSVTGTYSDNTIIWRIDSQKGLSELAKSPKFQYKDAIFVKAQGYSCLTFYPEDISKLIDCAKDVIQDVPVHVPPSRRCGIDPEEGLSHIRTPSCTFKEKATLVIWASGKKFLTYILDDENGGGLPNLPKSAWYTEPAS